METNIKNSLTASPDLIASGNSVSTENAEVQQNFDFVEQFLSLFVSDINPDVPNLKNKINPEAAKELAQKIKSLEGFTNQDLKSLFTKLDIDLPKLTTSGEFDLTQLEKLIEKISPNKLKKSKSNGINLNKNKLQKISNHTYSTEMVNSEEFLNKIKKYLSKTDFEKIKNSLQKNKANIQSNPVKENLQLNTLGIQYSDKEINAKQKITSKNSNRLLEILQPNVKSEEISLASTKVEKPISQEKQSHQAIIRESIANESNAKNGSFLNEDKGMFGENNQKNNNAKLAKEKLQTKVARTQLSDFISSSNTESVETVKSESTMRSNFVEKAIKTIKLAKNGVSSNARIVLQPKHLGSVNMRMNLIGNSVSLVIKAEKSETLQHIEKQLPALKEKLTESGLRLDQITYESSESNDLQNNDNNKNRHEQEELRRKFVNSIKNRAAKGSFEISDLDLANYNYSHLKVTN
ncbi:MAG: flagellar hook-length control protein FliK [Chlorobiota bacterium]